ncbi:uncharacterized protein LOC125379978 [Haliotis rufescens]|uniref:uncharacterized protein LOC125379978 n=1 Tax=Haliotis rufescens TaxID=6454 RepID=UPI00201EA14E|nr:uncharacterized protein LOC125379978 [Haliotis rufescens]
MFAKVKHFTGEIPTQNQVELSPVSASFFKYLRVISCLGGIFRRVNPGEKMTKWDRLKLVYVIFVKIVLMTSVVFFFIATYNFAIDSKPVARLLAFCTVMLLGVYLSFVYSIFLSKAFQLLHVRICKYEERYGFSDGFKKWMRKLRAMVIVVPLFAVVLIPLKYFMTMGYPEVRDDIYPTNTFMEPWKSVGLVITSIGYTCLEIQWQSSFIVVHFLSLFLWQEFNRVDTQFQELANSQRGDTEARFNTLVIHHVWITEVLEDINNYVQHFIFTCVFMTLPVICTMVYSILSNPVNSVEVIAYSTACVCTLLGFGLILRVGALVSSKAHGTLQYVWRLDKERFSGTGLQKMNLFVSRLTGDSIGYNIHGLFTITMPTLLGIVGTLVTYIIVVVQFKPPDTSCQCNMFRNLTEDDMR